MEERWQREGGLSKDQNKVFHICSSHQAAVLEQGSILSDTSELLDSRDELNDYEQLQKGFLNNCKMFFLNHCKKKVGGERRSRGTGGNHVVRSRGPWRRGLCRAAWAGQAGWDLSEFCYLLNFFTFCLKSKSFLSKSGRLWYLLNCSHFYFCRSIPGRLGSFCFLGSIWLTVWSKRAPEAIHLLKFCLKSNSLNTVINWCQVGHGRYVGIFLLIVRPFNFMSEQYRHILQYSSFLCKATG